jgi:hypothetical protein
MCFAVAKGCSCYSILILPQQAEDKQHRSAQGTRPGLTTAYVATAYLLLLGQVCQILLVVLHSKKFSRSGRARPQAPGKQLQAQDAPAHAMCVTTSDLLSRAS